MQHHSIKGFRASFLDAIADPFYAPESDCIRYFSDGLLIVENGKVKDLGNYQDLQAKYVDLPITEYRDRLIVSGFIDTHIHFPQTEMIASYGEQLLEWLSTYTFPTERKFADRNYALEIASIFLNELLRNGTTTALVFTAVFPQSTDAFFEEAQRRNLRMIAGKVMMDRNAPEFLRDTALSSYLETKQLIEKWHKCDRLLYAVTPRFALTSTPEQLTNISKLLQEYPDVYLHTHLSENVKEVEAVVAEFPESDGYLDVYDRAGLVTERSVFAHGVQLTDREFTRLSEAKSAIAFCPTSNLFLGSGLFKLEKAKSSETPVKVGLGTDVGAGTSFSILKTASAAYQVAQLRSQKLSAFQALFLATLGGARALCLEDKLGNFEIGKEADFVVLNLHSTPIMALRNQSSEAIAPTLAEISDQLFATIIMGDDRAIAATYIMGKLAHEA
ncbi:MULTISPECIES: guanine deaminase [Pseudanabaena]|jgi:guanine deaminase|uniref:guanine deaminase n=1 Tax=Pseudanabaena TaxID=1152 RepID=UPI002478E13F|nr:MULTISPECIES: guanine deaminase [Pseudanabaena]MEA5488335.1 guanine deaminase [Pseudanabaena sp. CCNP1317]WGS72841.1 guanine deaminase [Pseudanabaena galeata CCNP1313]